MVALIEYLRRGKNNTKFIDSPCWLLTTDHFLIRLQKSDIDFRNLPPLAVLPSQILNILRFVTPRDAKFDAVFLDVFSKTFIPMNNQLDNASIQQILGRIALYKGYTPSLAQAILSNQLFTEKFARSKSPEEKEELIHEAIVEKAGNLEIVIKNKDEALQKTAEELKTMRERVEKEEKEKTALIAQSQSAVEEISNLKGQITSIMEGEKKRRKNEKRIVGIILYCIISYFLYQYFREINPEQKLLRTGALSAIVLLIPVTSYLFFDNSRTGIVIGIIGLVGTVIGCLYSLV